MNYLQVNILKSIEIELTFKLLASLLFQQIPCAQHVHDAQSAVVQTVAGTDGAGTKTTL